MWKDHRGGFEVSHESGDDDDLERIQRLKDEAYKIATTRAMLVDTMLKAADVYAHLVEAEVAARRHALKEASR
jgi:hypothetical protein